MATLPLPPKHLSSRKGWRAHIFCLITHQEINPPPPPSTSCSPLQDGGQRYKAATCAQTAPRQQNQPQQRRRRETSADMSSGASLPCLHHASTAHLPHPCTAPLPSSAAFCLRVRAPGTRFCTCTGTNAVCCIKKQAPQGLAESKDAGHTGKNLHVCAYSLPHSSWLCTQPPRLWFRAVENGVEITTVDISGPHNLSERGCEKTQATLMRPIWGGGDGGQQKLAMPNNVK